MPKFKAHFKSRMYRKCLLALICLVSTLELSAQDTDTDKDKWQPGLTPAQKMIANSGEDLLVGGNADEHTTIISGYGEMSFRRDVAYKQSRASLDRVVLFVGHQFGNRLSFFSELEVADARIEAGGLRGEVGMEQAFLRYNINPRQYLVAGLITPRIGITNEAHLPINFYSSERPIVEQLVIPTTWRELGVGYYGQLTRWPIAYSVAIMNGLDASQMQHGFGIGKGSMGGQSINANSMAITGSLRGYFGDFQVQVSGYYGGANGMSPYTSDSLGINHGAFAIPVTMGEANIQYSNQGFSAKALGIFINNSGASEINRTFSNNAPEHIYGLYGELAYDLLYNRSQRLGTDVSLVGFVRYERLDLNAKIPKNAIIDGTLNQNHAIAGLAFFPTSNVVVKGDVRYTSTGAFNKNLMINPPPVMRDYPEKNYTVSISLGYAF